LSRYRTARIVALLVSGIGWFAAVAASFFTVFRLARTDVFNWATAFPFAILMAVGFALVLLGSMARAVFDIADRTP
jgi:hypothetical protein